MKEIIVYMMIEMMKIVLVYGIGRGVYLLWFL